MRLLVISDTHGDISKVCKVVNEIKDLIDGIIHLGDIVEDADKLRKLYSKIPVYNICGNCDYGTNVPPMYTMILLNLFTRLWNWVLMLPCLVTHTFHIWRKFTMYML